MSLYNNVSESLAKGGLIGSINEGLSAASKEIASATSSALGGGKLATAVGKIAGDTARNLALKQVDKHIPLKARRAINVGFGAAGDIMSGNYEKAGLRVLNSGLLRKLLPGMDGVVSQALYWGTPTPLMGGISPNEAKKIYDAARSQKRAKKNLFLIEVESLLDGASTSERFNMFVIGLDYSPYSMAGDRRRIGGASVDSLQGSEHTELSFTTYDDEAGSLKKWFGMHHNAASRRDGTMGVPASYAIKFKIVHAFITRDSSDGGYEDIGNFRANNLEVGLSRSEDALEELSMSFTQLDTFQKVK